MGVAAVLVLYRRAFVINSSHQRTIIVTCQKAILRVFNPLSNMRS